LGIGQTGHWALAKQGIGHWPNRALGIGQTGHWALAKQGIGQTGHWAYLTTLENRYIPDDYCQPLVTIAPTADRVLRSRSDRGSKSVAHPEATSVMMAT